MLPKYYKTQTMNCYQYMLQKHEEINIESLLHAPTILQDTDIKSLPYAPDVPRNRQWITPPCSRNTKDTETEPLEYAPVIPRNRQWISPPCYRNNTQALKESHMLHKYYKESVTLEETDTETLGTQTHAITRQCVSFPAQHTESSFILQTHRNSTQTLP